MNKSDPSRHWSILATIGVVAAVAAVVVVAVVAPEVVVAAAQFALEEGAAEETAIVTEETSVVAEETAADDTISSAEESRTNWGAELGKNNIKHNNAIEGELDNASERGSANIAKNRVQRDVNGNRVFT